MCLTDRVALGKSRTVADVLRNEWPHTDHGAGSSPVEYRSPSGYHSSTSSGVRVSERGKELRRYHCSRPLGFKGTACHSAKASGTPVPSTQMHSPRSIFLFVQQDSRQRPLTQERTGQYVGFFSRAKLSHISS